jgi:hypothetical protein
MFNSSELYNKTWLERIFFASQHNINFNFEQNDDKIAKPIPLVTLDQVIEEHDGLVLDQIKNYTLIQLFFIIFNI